MNKFYILILCTLFVVGSVYATKDDEPSEHSNRTESKNPDVDFNGDKDLADLGEENEESEEEEGDDDDHGVGKAIGKGKAIEAVDEVKGFKLSKEAIQTLELKFQTVTGGEFLIDKSTLVASKNLKGLYRFRGGFFKFLPVTILKNVKSKYLVKAKNVDSGDQVATRGVGLLRVTDIFSTDKSEYGE